MIRCTALFLAGMVVSMAVRAQNQPTQAASNTPAGPGWVEISNGYAKMLLDVAFEHHPEFATQQGLAQFDTKVAQPTLADEDKERAQTEAVLAKLKAAAAEKQQKEVAEDLQIMITRTQLTFRRQDFQRAHNVPLDRKSVV